jgi:hypothetical protein
MIPIKGKFFLDICSGPMAPLANAVRLRHRACLRPHDAHPDQGGLEHDLLAPGVVDCLLRMAWSGVVAFAAAAPPYSDYSLLGLRPGGPPAVRSANAMRGELASSPWQANDLQDSQNVHRSIVLVLQTVHMQGGQVSWENPPSSLSTHEPFVMEFLCKIAVHWIWISACNHGMLLSKVYLFATSFVDLAQLGSICQHASGHQSFGGRRNEDGSFMSRATAEYPQSLVEKFADIISLLLDEDREVFTEWADALKTLPGKPPAPSTTVSAADGGGIMSTADWRRPPRGKDDVFKELRHSWSQIICDHHIHKQVEASFAMKCPEAPITEPQLCMFAAALGDFFKAHALDTDWLVAEGQPFRLRVAHNFQRLMHDPDMALAPMLEKGVVTGVLSDIPPSGVWLPATPRGDHDLDLLACDGNWLSAEKDPDTVDRLLEADIDEGFVKEFHGDEEAAKRQWPAGVAIGKLGIAKAEGREDRLTLDTTVNNVNPRYRAHEKTFNPSHRDVTGCQDQQCQQRFVGMSLDVRKAHKRILVIFEEQGLLMFRHRGKLYYYSVCHFGGSFSAYWWSRFGALTMRLGHQFLFCWHNGYLYVDDYLWKFMRETAALQSTLLVVLFMLLGIPMSWKKCALEDSITWTGLVVNFGMGFFELPEVKMQKVSVFLAKVASTTKMERLQLEKGVGLLLWVTDVFSYLRPWLCLFYQSLARAHPTLVSCNRAQLEDLLLHCADDLRVTGQPALLHVAPGWKLLAVGGRTVNNKLEVSQCHWHGQRVWIRLHNHRSKMVKLLPETSDLARTWMPIFTGMALRKPIAALPPTEWPGAADAFAAGSNVGIGGWSWKSPTDSTICWFSLQLTVSEFPVGWQMNINAQRNIAAYELLAQTALLMMRLQQLPCQFLKISFRQSSDNTPTEGCVNRLFTTSQPLCFFLQNFTAWATLARAEVQIDHIPGELNELADGLSRDKGDVLQTVEPQHRFRLLLPDILGLKQKVTFSPAQAAWPTHLVQLAAGPRSNTRAVFGDRGHDFDADTPHAEG